MATEAKAVKVKNVSEDVQMFTGHVPFQPGEVREVSAEEGEILLRSPFMEETSAKPHVVKGKEAPGGTMKAVEKEND